MARRAVVTTLSFSNYEWKVKASAAGQRVGPGPNLFSANSRNAWVDPQGRLHLRITEKDGRWYCAEVISRRSFGYGTYDFVVRGVQGLDPSVVLGLFTWSDRPDYHHREIDCEVGRWRDAAADNAQFVVQPYTRPTNIVRFPIAPAHDAVRFRFDWRPERVAFECRAEGSTAPIRAWTFAGEGVPKAGGENARMNLWLFRGKPPADGAEPEVIIERFAFTPAR